MRVPALFKELCEYGLALGMKNISELPGCWEQKIDENWWIACNGHENPVQCSKSAGAATVPPFSFYIEFNGWPAGIVDAGGGSLCAGAIANEETLITALQSARKAVA
jgi:hypothetical protein